MSLWRLDHNWTKVSVGLHLTNGWVYAFRLVYQIGLVAQMGMFFV